jgi:hypothetical protein
MKQELIIREKPQQPSRLERLRGIVPFVPGGVSRQRVARNAILRRFQSRLSLVPMPMDGAFNDLDRKHMTDAAHRIARSDAVNDQALVEVRPFVPAEALRGGLGKNALTAVEVVKETLRGDGMSAIPNSHPIMPVEVHDGEPVDEEEIWDTIGNELDSFEHQARAERGIRNAAMVGVIDPRFAQHIFAPQLVAEGGFMEESQPMVLARVGEEPSEHVFAPVA